jgi:hypothetical protein
MKTFARTMLFGISMLSVAATAGAAANDPCPNPRNDAALLEDSRDRVAWQAQNAKGVDKHQLKAEEERLQGLIDELQRGGRVDAEEIDRSLNRTY